jgi:signal transduction histidine kinase
MRVPAVLRSLKTRLALSHALPVLLFVALLGVILLDQLERYYFLDNLAVELAAQGAIIASFTREEPEVWRDPQLAQYVLERLQDRIGARTMLLNSSGQVIASTWDAASAPVGALLDNDIVAAALKGEPSWHVGFSPELDDQMLDVAVPVTGDRGQLLGAVRLSHSLQEIRRRVAPLRSLVWITLAAGAGLSLLLGLVLAQSLAAPLTRLAAAVTRFTPAAPPEPFPETGPSEVAALGRAFNRMGQRLYDLERSRLVLLTGIVHELGRPLGAIKAAAQTIRATPDRDLAVDLATGIDTQVNQLRLQVDDLVLLGEVELQGLRMVMESLDLDTLLQELCRQSATAAAEKQIRLTCQVDGALPPLQADPKRIHQILGNLLHNALKYTPAGGTVSVRAYGADARSVASVVVEVSDTGPGIDPAEHERIFDFFYRGVAQARIHEGMGIGLALARQLAVAHGGSLTVQSAGGAGATFVLTLPCVPPAALPSLAHSPQP